MQQAIALCRVSTSAQRIEGHSLESQELNVQKAADELGVPIVKMWSHDVSSRIGKNQDRKDLKEMMDYCRTHKAVKYLIIDVPDRFMRDIEYYYYFKVSLKQIGVKIYYASLPEINNDDSFSRLKENFQILQAEMSNRERMTKCTDGLKNRVRAGFYPFHPHLGYRRGDTPGLHIVDPLRFSLLQQAFQGVAYGLYTPSEAHKWLNSTDFATLTGKKIKIDKFLVLLRDPYYAGIVEVKNWEIQAKGLHEAMITWAEHEKIEEMLDGKKTKYIRQKNNPEFPLNRSFCECGGKITGFMHSNGQNKGWKRPEYRCRTCGKQYVRDSVHSSLNELLKRIELTPTKREKMIRYLEVIWKEKQETNLNFISTLENKIIELKTQKQNLVLTLSQRPELSDDITESIEQVKIKINETAKKLDEAKNIEEDLVEFVDFSLKMAHAFQTKWWTISHENRQKCKQLLFPNDFFIKANEKVYTKQISPIYRFANVGNSAKNTQKSQMVELRGLAPLSKKRFHNH